MARPRAGADFQGTERFEVVRVLGAGGMGVVYEAFDRERRCRVALKTFRHVGPEARLRLKTEFRSLQGIQHPNLIGLGELLEEDGRLFFTMELVRGVDFLIYVQVYQEDEDTNSSPRRTPPIPRTKPSHAGQSSRDEDDTPPPSSHFSPPSRSWRRPGVKTFDDGRLRRAFGQLALAVNALHVAGKVHRDLKPSNALVTAGGRVVLLDFGLVADAASTETGEMVVGTEKFMAPEQAAGRPVGPEADWYSMGVILYLALTGAYPFDTSARLVLDLKQREDPPSPATLVEGLPEDLVALCVDLLRRDPAARPDGAEVLRRLGLAAPLDGPAMSRRPDLFVGRRRELRELEEAFAEARAGQAVTRIIQGESGVGKSALLRRFLEQIAGEAQVLSGRCYERELLPYKAVDELIDALRQVLARMPRQELLALLPEDATLLGEVFPALAELMPPPDEDAFCRDTLNPREARARAAGALRDLFRGLAQRRPLVLTIDDLQWADSDGLGLLADLMRPPGAPPVLLLCTMRTGTEAPLSSGVRPVNPSRNTRPPPPKDEAGVTGNALLLQGEVRVLEVRDLPAEESRELVRMLLRGSDMPESTATEALAAEAGGHPLFIDALVRYRLSRQGEASPARLDDILWARMERLEPSARRLLELASVAGGPLPLDVAARAVPADAIELDRLVSALRGASLIRSAAGRAGAIEPYHDRVRETIVSRMERDAVRAWHGRLALALEASGRADLEALAAHWRGAGEAERAAGYAARAADQAAAALAFDRAARLYRLAIDLAARPTDGSPPSLRPGGTMAPPPSLRPGPGTVIPPAPLSMRSGSVTLAPPPSTRGSGTMAPPAPPSTHGPRTVAPPASSSAYGSRTVAPPAPSSAYGSRTVAPPASSSAYGSRTMAPPASSSAYGSRTVAPPAPPSSYGSRTVAPPPPPSVRGSGAMISAPPPSVRGSGAMISAPPPSMRTTSVTLGPPAPASAPGSAERFSASAESGAARAAVLPPASDADPAEAHRRAADRRLLLTKLGDALSSSGRGAEAGEAYLAALRGAPPTEALELGRRAAETLLRSGYIDGGLAILRGVLSQVDIAIPATPTRAISSLLYLRARLRLRGLDFQEREARTIPSAELTHVDICWTAALGVGNVLPVAGFELQSRHLLLALQLGEPYRVARALAVEALFVSSTGGPAIPRATELLEAAGEVARRINNPHAIGLFELSTGIAAYMQGRFAAALESLDRADTIFRDRCTGVSWERGTAQTFALWSLRHLGSLRELSRRLPACLRGADQRGDRYLAMNLRCSDSNVHWLVRDDVPAALREVETGARGWPTKLGSVQLPSYGELLARTHILLYQGDAEAAYQLIEERWPELEGSQLLRMQSMRVWLNYLRAGAAITLAASSEVPSVLLKEAERSAARIASERMPWSDPLAVVIRAAITFHHGQAADAVEAMHLLGEAIAGFEASHMALHAMAARRRRGEIHGGARGQAEVEAANQWMRDQGVVNPDRFVDMIAPGFPARRAAPARAAEAGG